MSSLRNPFAMSAELLYEQWKRVVLPNIGMDVSADVHEYMVSLLTTNDPLARAVHVCMLIHNEPTLQSYYMQDLNPAEYGEWLKCLHEECEALLNAPFNMYDTPQRMSKMIETLTARFPFLSNACADTDNSALPPPDGSTPMNTA